MRPLLIVLAACAAIVAGGCGSGSGSGSTSANAPESSPPGDIPDNQAYVRFAPPSAGFTVKVPEGWARTTTGGAVTFTDKLNAVRIETAPAHTPLTVPGARRTEVPKLAASVAGFRAGKVGAVSRSAGTAVRITYLAAAKRDPVTGKGGRDAVERYVFFHKGQDVVLTLSGPKGADNVDPWRIVTDSVRWSR
jgi:hypothetical protein